MNTFLKNLDSRRLQWFGDRQMALKGSYIRTPRRKKDMKAEKKVDSELKGTKRGRQEPGTVF